MDILTLIPFTFQLNFSLISLFFSTVIFITKFGNRKISKAFFSKMPALLLYTSLNELLLLPIIFSFHLDLSSFRNGCKKFKFSPLELFCWNHQSFQSLMLFFFSKIALLMLKAKAIDEWEKSSLYTCLNNDEWLTQIQKWGKFLHIH